MGNTSRLFICICCGCYWGLIFGHFNFISIVNGTHAADGFNPMNGLTFGFTIFMVCMCYVCFMSKPQKRNAKKLLEQLQQAHNNFNVRET
jgi:hypothetical protein